MKQIIQNYRSGVLKVEEVPAPTVRDGALLVATQVSLISAGTERSTVQVAQKNLAGKAMERPDLAVDERFRTRDQRVKHVREVDALVEAWTSSRTLSELLPRLETEGVPAAEVREPEAAVRDPRVVARGETVRLEHPKYGAVENVHGTGLPIKFSAATAGFDQHAPEMGQHNQMVYGQMLGYSPEKIEELRAQGII